MENKEVYVLTIDQLKAYEKWVDEHGSAGLYNEDYLQRHKCPLPPCISDKEVSEKSRENVVKIICKWLNIKPDYEQISAHSIEELVDALISAGYLSPTQSKEPIKYPETSTYQMGSENQDHYMAWSDGYNRAIEDFKKLNNFNQ